MNKKQAKQDACHHAARLIQGALANGWETDTLYADAADHERFLDALQELTNELLRRGAGRVADDTGSLTTT